MFRLCLKITLRELPGRPVVRTPCFPAKDAGWIPSSGTKILYTVWHGQMSLKKNHI